MFAGAIAIVARRPVVFGAVVLVGCFVREAALFLVPFAYAVWAERLWDPRAARQTVLAALPAVAAYAALRLSVPALHRERVLGYDSLLGGRIDVLREAAGEPLRILRRLAIAFGPLWLAAPFALRDLPFARRGLVLLAVCAAGMLFALDWGRIAFLAAPAVVVAAAWALNSRPRLAVAAVVAFLAMDVGYAIYMEDFGGAQDGIIDVPPTRYPAV
jgi:asparagine N-glycosylation enzyme membrane subunit Stt3